MLSTCGLVSLLDPIFCFYVLTAFKFQLMMSLYLGLCIIIFSVVLVLDLFMIVNRLRVDEYIVGATIIYIDIMRIFGLIIAMARRSS